MDKPKVKTLVLGATDNPGRYAFLAVSRLRGQGHPVIAVGKKSGEAADITIQHSFPSDKDIHTITMYLNAANQKMYHEQILAARPKRIIFNPGSENPILKNLALAEGIAVEEACTLVMLATGSY